MNALRFRRPLPLFAAVVALVMALALSGCGSDGSDGMAGSAEQKMGDSYLTTAGGSESFADRHGEKVYVIGNLSGTLADEIEQVFMNRVAYDGVSTDAPILVAADRVQSLSDIEREGIFNTFQNCYPVAVLHGKEEQINALLGILGLEQNYTLPAGKPVWAASPGAMYSIWQRSRNLSSGQLR